jgi:hypothetical protein
MLSLLVAINRSRRWHQRKVSLSIACPPLPENGSFCSCPGECIIIMSNLVSQYKCIYSYHLFLHYPSPCFYLKPAWSSATCFLLISSLAYSSTLKMVVTCSSEMSVDFQQTTQHYIPKDRPLHNHCCEIFKSYETGPLWTVHFEGGINWKVGHELYVVWWMYLSTYALIYSVPWRAEQVHAYILNMGIH